jgi:hypothetical protein
VLLLNRIAPLVGRFFLIDHQTLVSLHALLSTILPLAVLHVYPAHRPVSSVQEKHLLIVSLVFHHFSSPTLQHASTDVQRKLMRILQVENVSNAARIAGIALS